MACSGDTMCKCDQCELSLPLISSTQVVASDQRVAKVFARECFTHDPDNPSFAGPKVLAGKAHESRQCVADEHYMPTTLAAHGLDNEVLFDGKLCLLHQFCLVQGWSCEQRGMQECRTAVIEGVASGMLVRHVPCFHVKCSSWSRLLSIIKLPAVLLQTDCQGQSTHAEWRPGEWSPHSYTPEEVPQQIIWCALSSSCISVTLVKGIRWKLPCIGA